MDRVRNVYFHSDDSWAEYIDLPLAPHVPPLCSSTFSRRKSFLFPYKKCAVDAGMSEKSILEIHFDFYYKLVVDLHKQFTSQSPEWATTAKLWLPCLSNVSVNTTKVRLTVRNISGILLTTTWEVRRLEWEAEDGVYVETAFPWLLRGSRSVGKRGNFS